MNYYKSYNIIFNFYKLKKLIITHVRNARIVLSEGTIHC